MDATARNSDCQFCRVLPQNSGDSTYSPQVPGSCRLASCSCANALKPATDWANHDNRKIAPITMAREFEYSRVRQPPARAHDGESGVACSPTCWS